MDPQEDIVLSILKNFFQEGHAHVHRQRPQFSITYRCHHDFLNLLFLFFPVNERCRKGKGNEPLTAQL
ncbi:hypothetical protein EUGRSUZ_G02627 [Eucalyptus grandis]|uniref:Uncharacterized protein n=2 Tax=Eucalyptus grandis TaxID=71139 RepID=A0ACC3K772_EUCGR|nr:hypothetical protein EUGRSUZ_G02627 [Eucalyptus grandis]